MIRLEDISKAFAGVPALDCVTLDIQSGEVHTLCGENGAGKSTLMNVLAGVWPHGTYTGRILHRPEQTREPEREWQFHSVNDAVRAGIAIVHQELALMPDMSVLDNLFMGAERSYLGWLDKRRQREQAEAHFARLEFHPDLDMPVRDLTIGMQQRLEIARALLAGPAVLVLDEPTSALPPDDAAQLLEWIRGLANAGTACVYISHRMDEVFRISDRITVLRDGHTVWTRPASEVNADDVIKAMVDRPPTDIYRHEPCAAGRPLCIARNLRVTRRHRIILDVDRIEIREGEIVGLAGMMGAGRTCLLRALAGALDNVRVRGVFQGPNDREGSTRTLPRHAADAFEQGVFLIPEDRKREALFLDDGLAANVAAATYARYRHHGGVDQYALEAGVRHRAVEFSVKAADLHTPVRRLSGGNQQKVLLCRAAEVAPRVLLLDEPTRGIDVGTKEAIYRRMEAWARQGWGILWSSSELQELLGISDRIYVLASGRVTAEFNDRPFGEEAVMAKAAVSGREDGDSREVA